MNAQQVKATPKRTPCCCTVAAAGAGAERFTYYHDLTKVVADRVYDRWIRLNVVHDVAAGNVTVFVGGERRLEVQGHGGKEHYFNFGVYTKGLHKHSHRMEAHWKNVTIYTKP